MTIHIERVSKRFKEKYNGYILQDDQKNSHSLEVIEQDFIKSHISYIEKELVRLKERLKGIYSIKKGNRFLKGEDKKFAGCVNNAKINLLENEINIKEQELLKSKMMIK
jgi:hypothetical protein